MPQAAAAVVAAIAYVGTATTAVVAGTATLAQIATVAAVGIGAGVAGTALSRTIQPQIGSQGSAGQWHADPDEPLRFPFGRVGVKGSIKHAAVYGPDSMYVSFACTVGAAGPIKSFVNFRAGDYIVAFDGNGKAVSQPYANEMWLSTRRGLQPDTALSLPSGLKNGVAMPGWSSASKLSGAPAYLVTLGENSKRSAYNGQIPPFRATIEGLYCYDPRLDSTVLGGSGSCRLNSPTTWIWSENPILFALKWALGLWEGPTGKGAPGLDYQVGGIGVSFDRIHLASLFSALNTSDANAWKSAAYPSTDDDKDAVLDGFLKAGGARYAEIAGQMAFIHRAAPRSPSFTVTARDTAGPVEIDTTAPTLNRINTIRPRYWSEDHEWEMTALPEVTSTQWQEEDGQGVAVKRTRGVDYDFVPVAKQTRELAVLDIAHGREGIRGRVPLRPYMDPEPGNCFIFDEPDFALSDLKCFVLEVEDNTDDDTISVIFETETDGKYPYAYGQIGSPPPAQTLDPTDPTFVSPPGSGDWEIIVTPPGTGGERIPSFDLIGAVDNAAATAILVEWAPTASGPWTQAYFGPPTVTKVPLVGIQPRATYYVGVTNYRNSNSSARQVYGPYEAPPLVATDTANVDNIPAPDLTARLVSAEALAEANSAAVEDLEQVYGDTVSAAASALAADASADNAYLSEIAAAGSAGTAVTQAGIATTKASEAGISSAAAQVSRVAADTAAAKAVKATRNGDFDFQQEGWSWDGSGAPVWFASGGSFGQNIIEFQNGQGGGGAYVGEAVTIAPGNARYELSLKYRILNATQTFYAGVLFYDAAGALIGATDGSGNYPLAAPNTVGPETVIDRRVVIGRGGAVPASPWGGTSTIPAGAAIFRPVLFPNYNSVAGGTSQLDHFRVEDVTQREAASGSASAAATSASQALASEGAAGASASAASGSATTATTKAGEAQTFRNQASSSAADAVSARDTAGTHATNAVGSAATATAQASIATEKALEASQSAVLAVGVNQGYANQNPSFSAWPNPATAPAQGWSWAGALAGTRVSRPVGSPLPYSVGFDTTGGSTTSWLRYLAADQSAGFYVVVVEITLRAGTLGGCGFLFRPLNPGGVPIVFHEYDFGQMASDPATGAPGGNGVVGQTYRISLIFDCTGPLFANMNGVDFYVVTDAYFSSNPKNVEINLAGWRKATADEIAQRQVLGQLGASVSTQAQAMLDLKTNYAQARYQVAALAPGGAAILSLVSDTFGSVAGLSADKIYFGQNTVFDDATDTMRTTIGGNVRVVAYGAAFGTDGTLTSWEGPAGTPFASMSRANAYFYTANVAPYAYSPSFGAGSPVIWASLSYGRQIGRANNAYASSDSTAKAPNAPSGDFLIDITGFATSNGDGSLDPEANGEMQLVRVIGGVETQIGGTVSISTVGGEWMFDPSLLPTSVPNSATSPVTWRIKIKGMGGSTAFSIGTARFTLKATWVP